MSGLCVAGGGGGGDGDGRQQQVTTWATKHNACDDPQAEKGVRLERWSAEGAVCCPGLLHPLSSLHTLLCVCFLLFASVRNSVGGVVAWKMGQTLWTGIRIFLLSCFPCFTSYDDYDFFSLLCEREKREKEDWGKKTCDWWWWRGGVLAAAWWRYYCLFWAMTWRRRWGMGREKRVVAFVSC